jgi:hypothetical protein
MQATQAHIVHLLVLTVNEGAEYDRKQEVHRAASWTLASYPGWATQA